MAETSRRTTPLFRVRRPDTNATRLLAALVLAVAFGVTGGPLGVVGGLLVAGASLVVAAPVTVALGHVVLLGLLPDPTLPQLAVLEFGFVLALVAPATTLAAPRRTGSATVLCFVGLAGVLGLALGAVDDLWVVCGVLVAVVALAAYGLYRYELVQRGLVGDAEPNDGAERES